MYVAADRDWAFLRHCEHAYRKGGAVHVPLAARWIHPATLRGPVMEMDQYAPYTERGCRKHVSHTFSHSLCTSLSASCLQLMRLSIQPSRVGIVAGSDAGADDSCMGSGILTSSMLVSMVAGW